ncbi:hypothetical protein ACRQ5Q_10610 [Bradyrhizobium sp. PMVTL-01]|uniref:hypothetical protein n=1 Tax=Bradyrhizobium sp. PMVTL-01 TaxID=3434999 RepID=UPI003F7037BC
MKMYHEQQTIFDTLAGENVINRAARLGAEIRNLRLSADLSDDVIRAIKQLLREQGDLLS